MLPPLRSQSLSSWIFLTLKLFPARLLGCRAGAVPLHCCGRDRENTVSQLYEFNYGFGENKLRQRMPMYFQNQPVLSLHGGDHWGWMKDRHCRQKLVTRGRALKGWTGSVYAGSKGSNASHINWDVKLCLPGHCLFVLIWDHFQKL